MHSRSTAWQAQASTALFVLLWSSGAIFSRWGLDHASAFVFLVLRFALALAVLLAIGLARRRWLPEPGTRLQVAACGLLLIGGYSSCYFLALDHGVTPGVLATVLGAQPVLTLVLFERRFAPARLAGLGLALCGLVLVVYDSIALARMSPAGTGFALAALACMTAGAIAQKRVDQPPAQVLPLQYGVSLLLCAALLPSQPLRLEVSMGLAVALLWLGVVISVVATLLLYRMIQSRNLVNVTSLFYLVPAGTALLDWLVLGNRLAPAAIAGMLAILAGLVLVFRVVPPAAVR